MQKLTALGSSTAGFGAGARSHTQALPAQPPAWLAALSEDDDESLSSCGDEDSFAPRRGDEPTSQVSHVIQSLSTLNFTDNEYEQLRVAVRNLGAQRGLVCAAAASQAPAHARHELCVQLSLPRTGPSAASPSTATPSPAAPVIQNIAVYGSYGEPVSVLPLTGVSARYTQAWPLSSTDEPGEDGAVVLGVPLGVPQDSAADVLEITAGVEATQVTPATVQMLVSDAVQAGLSATVRWRGAVVWSGTVQPSGGKLCIPCAAVQGGVPDSAQLSSHSSPNRAATPTSRASPTGLSPARSLPPSPQSLDRSALRHSPIVSPAKPPAGMHSPGFALEHRRAAAAAPGSFLDADSTASSVSIPPPPPAVSTQSTAPASSAKPAPAEQLEQSFTSLQLFNQQHQGRAGDAAADIEASVDSLLDLVTSSMSGLPSATRSVPQHPAAAGAASAASSPAQPALGDDLEGSLIDIPLEPAGQALKLRIFSTWGDPFYVSLTAVEVFSAAGERVHIPAANVHASPPAVQSSKGVVDPRQAQNLVDEHVWTSDALHTWLAPWQPGAHTAITLQLPARTALGMVRIWNSNTSRIHSYRGARQVQLELDGRVIFSGEVRKAPGDTKGPPQAAAEPVLFTLNEAALQAIDAHDKHALPADASDSAANVGSALIHAAQVAYAGPRPATADTAGGDVLAEAEALLEAAPVKQQKPSKRRSIQRRRRAPEPIATYEQAMAAAGLAVPEQRPSAPISSVPLQARSPLPSFVLSHAGQADSSQLSSMPKLVPGWQAVPGNMVDAGGLPRARVVDLWFVDTWDDPWYAGLCGVEVWVAIPSSEIAPAGGTQPAVVQRYRLAPAQLFAQPRDINVDGHSGDVRTLDKLVNGQNVTTLDSNMWLIPFVPNGSPEQVQVLRCGSAASGSEGCHVLQLRLAAGHEVPLHIAAIRVWNYNKCASDTSRGVRRLLMTLDGQPVLPGPAAGLAPVTRLLGSQHVPQDTCVTLRRAPGNAAYDFGQTLALGTNASGQPTVVGPPIPKQQLDLQAGPASLHQFWTKLLQGRVPYVRGVPQDCEPPMAPVGHTWRFVFRTSHADHFYIGLDGIALLDVQGYAVPFTAAQVHAVPDPGSVEAAARASAQQPARKVPPAVPVAEPPLHDRRVPDALCPLAAATTGPAPNCPPGRGPWLAPLAHSIQPGQANELIIALDHPHALGAIKLWNYSKTPARGVRDMQVWLDGLLIYAGNVPAAVDGARSAPHCVLLCQDPAWIDQEGSKLNRAEHVPQAVSAWDAGQQRAAVPASELAPVAAEGVRLDPALRPLTAVLTPAQMSRRRA